MTRIISSFLKTSLMGATLVAATALAATPAVAQNADKIFNYKGADRQQMLEKGAKKEGKVTFYSALSSTKRSGLWPNPSRRNILTSTSSIGAAIRAKLSRRS